MSDQTKTKPHKPPHKPIVTVEYIKSIGPGNLQDLCDATDAAISDGGGFGWLRLPARDILERYWEGVLTMPSRMVFVAKLDGVICGTAQLITPPKNNEAQSFSVKLTSHFVAPWARGYGLARKLVKAAEEKALEEGFAVIDLDVRETQKAAIKLYESMGYIHFGTHPYYARADNKVVKGSYYYKVIDPKAVEQSQ